MQAAVPDEYVTKTVPLQVTLHLKPIHSLKVHQRPLAFVLNSPQPVLWKLEMEKLAPNVQRVFHVSLQLPPRLLVAPVCPSVAV